VSAGLCGPGHFASRPRFAHPSRSPMTRRQRALRTARTVSFPTGVLAIRASLQPPGDPRARAAADTDPGRVSRMAAGARDHRVAAFVLVERRGAVRVLFRLPHPGRLRGDTRARPSGSLTKPRQTQGGRCPPRRSPSRGRSARCTGSGPTGAVCELRSSSALPMARRLTGCCCRSRASAPTRCWSRRTAGTCTRRRRAKDVSSTAGQHACASRRSLSSRRTRRE
jgi:hypothetical protein